MQLDRIRRLDQLIRLRATGSPQKLAEKMEVSKRRVYQCIQYMKKEFQAPIRYSKAGQSYIYSGPGKLILGWDAKKI